MTDQITLESLAAQLAALTAENERLRATRDGGVVVKHVRGTSKEGRAFVGISFSGLGYPAFLTDRYAMRLANDPAVNAAFVTACNTLAVEEKPKAKRR